MPLRLAQSCALLLLAAAALAHGGEHGLQTANIDSSANPCHDFFQYANGAWLRTTGIPADHDTWGVDEEIDQRNLDILRDILDNAASQPAGGLSRPSMASEALGLLPGDGPIRKIGDFYAAAIDEAAIESAGLAPLREDLAAIAALKTADDVAALIRDWHVRGFDVLFELQAQEDLKDSATNIAYAGQGGLGLPDRDYYLRHDAKSALLRAHYREHIGQMLALLGDARPKEEAGHVLDLETLLAKASLDSLALRDPQNSYHVVTLAQADAASPHFAWPALFAAGGREDVQRFSLAQPEFFAAAGKALGEVPVATWQSYLRWQLINAAAPYLGKTFVDADFAFRGRALRGVKDNKPRWKRAIESTDVALGEALGQAYVEKVMPPESRQRALELIGNLKAALRTRLQNLDWIGDTTRQTAYAKLDTLGAKIGYPDHWRDYSTLEISRDSYYLNMRAAAAFDARRQFAKFNRPVDRAEWDMTPQTVNAYNNPMRNEIVFPAAQLLPPYFDAQADDALNYGAIGGVIGHEMLHSFDDQGSKFDANGNLADWWSSADRAHFEARTQVLVRQFNAYVPVDSLHIDGRLTLGENIADLGGLLVAYDAFKLTAQGRSNTPIGGLTPDQRFFLAYAQSWREQQRPQQLRLQLQSNEHAPAKYRVNGPLSNLPAFAHAFGCRPGDPMVRSDAVAVKIW
ncbi:MAG TPA: M13 family metallopeptidase [Rudaea sp.]|nr:M13 family metallopeptidase [Rudaea sp.]